MRKILRNMLNGMIIGSSMLLPGVSGGSMAIILGVYDRLIHAVSNLRKEFFKSVTYLSVYAVCGAVGILLFSKPLLNLTNLYEKPMMFLFLGAVCGSLPLLLDKAELKKDGYQRIRLAYVGIGFLSVLITELLPEELFAFQSALLFSDYILLLIIGIILSVALVLPGISFSYMLLVLGIYKPALEAIQNLQLPFLITLGGGVLLGILLCTKVLSYVMTRHPTETFLLILGFVLGTMRQIYPGFPTGSSFIVCFLTFSAGLMGIFTLSATE